MVYNINYIFIRLQHGSRAPMTSFLKIKCHFASLYTHQYPYNNNINNNNNNTRASRLHGICSSAIAMHY